MIFRRCFLFVLLMSFTGLAIADEKVPPSTSLPFEVTSRQMEADQLQGVVDFVGDVVGKRGGMTIYADRLSILFVEVEGARQIDKIEAEGNVRVVEGERIATADSLEYLQASEKMTLRGNAEVHQGENLVAGEEIELFVRENRSLVRSKQDGRVRAVFQPSQEKK